MATHLEHLLSQATLRQHPLHASIELTYACNLACRFCYNPIARKNQLRSEPPSSPTNLPLTFEEIVDLLDQLRELGVLYLTLTGGEPILHPRFWDIAKEAKDRTFALRIFTNGASLSEPAIDRLAELAPYCLEMSIHGARPETAQALTQAEGSFDRQMRALEMLKERGLRVYLKCLVTKLVENELEAIKAIGERFDYPVYFDPVITLSDDGQSYPLDLMASDEALRRLYSSSGLNVGNSPFERKPGQYNCGVGRGTIHVTPFGDIQPCVQWKQSIGNLRQTTLRDMWENSALLQEVRAITLAAHEVILQEVEDHAFCSHCPALSLLSSGDPLRPDKQYLRVARIRRSAAENVAKEEPSF